MSSASTLPVMTLVIPSHNRCGMLQRAIASSICQTGIHLEIIVVDDGSTDATRETVLEFEDQNVRYIFQHNRGASAARNLGICAASSDWVAFLDDDDELNPVYGLYYADTLRRLSGVTDTKIGFIWSGIKRIHSDTASAEQSAPRIILNPADADFHFLTRLALSHGVAIRRTALLEVGLFDESMKCSEDSDLFLRLLSAGWEGVDIPQSLVTLHIHAQTSLSRSGPATWVAWCNQRLIDKNQAFLDRHPKLLSHYLKGLVGDYYRIGNIAAARSTLLTLLRRRPWSLGSIFRALKFEFRQHRRFKSSSLKPTDRT
jgi:glycosyltransferase involved in cell wall biosynthesis